MKRMSEVFKLPVRSVDIEWMTAMSSDEQDEAIAHAINHVDALADALEALMDWNVKNVKVEHHPIYDIAFDALAAYRGEK